MLFRSPGDQSDNERKRYNRLFFLGMQIAARGKYVTAFLEVERRLIEVLDLLMAVDGTTTSKDIVEVMPKKKGAPRKKGNSQPRTGPNCVLCEGNHKLKKCPRYSYFKVELENYIGSNDISGKLCSACGYRGHNVRTCPPLNAARLKIKKD